MPHRAQGRGLSTQELPFQAREDSMTYVGVRCPFYLSLGFRSSPGEPIRIELALDGLLYSFVPTWNVFLLLISLLPLRAVPCLPSNAYGYCLLLWWISYCRTQDLCCTVSPAMHTFFLLLSGHASAFL